MLLARTWVRTTATVVVIAALVAFSSSSDDDHERIINNHLQEGNDSLSNGEYLSAIQSYEECLILDPNNRYCNINYASALVDADYDIEEDDKSVRRKKAIEILHHVMTLYPKDGDAAFNLALLLQDMSKSIENTRESASLYQIAVESMEQEQEQTEQQWDALANLAASRQELGIHFGTYGSLRCYERAIVHLEGLAQQYNTYIDTMINNHDAGTRAYDEEGYQHAQSQVLEMNVYTSKLYYGYGTILSELSSSDCLRLMEETESLLFDTERTTTLKIRTLTDQKQQQEQQAVEESAKEVCIANAINALRMAVNLDGNNVLATHMLTAITGGNGNDEGGGYTRLERASNAFVSALFDDFAETFDDKLGALAYQVPQLIGQAAYDLLQMTHRETFDSALDAGCGTGLAGRFLRPLVSGPLVGIDLSRLMLNKAKECTLTKGCGFKVLVENGNDTTDTDDDTTVSARNNRPLYDNLVKSDLETVTLTNLTLNLSSTDDETAMAAVGGFDLIVAADVFVYIGNLEKILHNFAKLMKVDDSMESFLIFSCERIDDDNYDDQSNDGSKKQHQQGWKVQTSGRYAHSKMYVTEVAENAGFELVRYDKIIPRMEKGQKVQGHLFVFGIGGVRLVEVDRLNANYGVHVQYFNDNDSHLEDRDPALDEL
jgi:predicted TPR repeat methyltransferase